MDKDKLKRKKVILIILAVVIACLVAGFLVYFLNSSIEKAVYNERKGALVQLTNTSASAINNDVNSQWEIARIYRNDVKTHINDFNTVEEYLQYLNTQISNEEDYYFLVDSKGKYYCSDGVNGKITATDYYVDEREEVEYLDTLPHFKDGLTYLILRTRLDEPIYVNSENGKTEIQYCCLMHSMSTLVKNINSLFDGNNNVMIYDTDTGLMLYKQFGLGMLLDGYNVFEKYRIADLAYGSNGEQIIEDIKNKQTNVSLMLLKGEKYYLCTSPLDVSNWALIIVVEGNYFNSESGAAYANVVIIAAVILAVICILFILLIGYLNKLKTHKMALESEHRVNEALNEAYQIKSNFLSYMSHDIRTPINGMIGMSQIGIANSDNREKVEDCFNKISLSSRHLLSIVNDVLDMSAIESGKLVTQSVKMNILDTLKDCRDIIVGLLDNRKLSIEESYDCETEYVLGDEFHFKQIIINILSNAVKYTDDGGTIKISCKQIEENADTINYRIEISDTGIGMSEEFIEHIFEAFRVANYEEMTKYKGSGLGMAISYEYVKLMKGTITVASKLNEGSTFTIVLPFKKINEGNHRNIKKMNVLLVDDNEINIEIAKEAIKNEVKSIEIALNGKEALDIFLASEEHHFDLVLMDVIMPVMNGVESARAIRESGRADSNVIIIALTANVYKDDIDAIMDSGMDGYISKPFTINQLLDKIGEGEQPVC